jgi:uncharacterized membrane protein YsdA (DUF1294 family)
VDETWIWIAVGLLAVNLWAFGQLAWDKRCARVGARRVSEARLIAPVLLGGLPGILLGMSVFRHKTAKRSFQLKLAALALVFAVGVGWFGRSLLLGGG